jgi:hypothetical protein
VLIVGMHPRFVRGKFLLDLAALVAAHYRKIVIRV